jgi:hypothetical protein
LPNCALNLRAFVFIYQGKCIINHTFAFFFFSSNKNINNLFKNHMNKKIIIGVSGDQGSFSEEAADYYCHKNNIKGYELAFCCGRVSPQRTLPVP